MSLALESHCHSIAKGQVMAMNVVSLTGPGHVVDDELLGVAAHVLERHFLWSWAGTQCEYTS